MDKRLERESEQDVLTPPERNRKSRWGFRGMTVRNWLELLVVPLVLAGIGFWFTWQQNERQQKIEERRADEASKIESRRAETEQELAERRAQDQELQAYLGRMSELMLRENFSNAEEGDAMFTLAQARTTTVLASFDEQHNRSVARFLTDSGLTGADDPLTGENSSQQSLLARADLQSAELAGAPLQGADLTGSSLKGADLARALLQSTTFVGQLQSESGATVHTVADLSGADLSNTALQGANLAYCYLNKADLHDAALQGADLSNAQLGDADLRGAALQMADLSGANLRGANLRGELGSTTGANLADFVKSLEGATMPDGQVLKSDDCPDCPTFDDWLKSKGSGKDVEHSGPS